MMGRRRIEGSATASTASSPSSIPTNSIAHNPRNPRDGYDDVVELADSMRQVGVLQPLGVVRYEVYLARYPEHEQDIGSAHWVVVQGNRRLAAARLAEIPEVPVVIQERLGRENFFDESVLIENIHRTDLPPLREAATLRELVEKHGSQRKVATVVGKTSGWVTQRLSLLKLVPELQAKLAAEELTIADARDLAQIPSTRQIDAYHKGAPYRESANSQPVDAKPPAVPKDSGSPKETHNAQGAYGVSALDRANDRSENSPPPPIPPQPVGVETEPGAYTVSTSPPVPSGQDQLADLLRQRYTSDGIVELLKSSFAPEQCAEIGRQLQHP